MSVLRHWFTIKSIYEHEKKYLQIGIGDVSIIAKIKSSVRK